MDDEKNMGYEEMGEIRGTDEEENAAISEALENRAEATAGEECAWRQLWRNSIVPYEGQHS